ncbi:MAG: hypothetical protein KJ955_05585 [Nanoarchaeota archaeon]|nr:hypothetical protein [Nanoarchaeota archaeon]
MHDIHVTNKKVAINRWAKVFALQKKLFEKNSRKYPLLKARLLGYIAGDGSISIHKEKHSKEHHTIRFYPDDKSMLDSFLFAFNKIYEKSPMLY